MTRFKLRPGVGNPDELRIPPVDAAPSLVDEELAREVSRLFADCEDELLRDDSGTAPDSKA